MPASDVFVSVVAPLEDDGDVLAAFLAEIMAVLEASYTNFEVVLVDDGSTDATQALVDEALRRHRCLRYIRLARRFGSEAAIAAGLDSVIGDFTVVMEPANDPPRLIPELVQRARVGSGVVFGIRTAPSGAPQRGSLGRRLFWAFSRRFLSLQVPEGASNLQCLSRNAVNALTRVKDKYRSIRLLAAGVGATFDTVAYTPLGRRAVPRRRSLAQSVDAAIGLMVSQSTRPLRFVALLGLGASLLNLVHSLLASHGPWSAAAGGWRPATGPGLAVLLLLLFATLAVLSEYVGRVLEETRGHPLYHALEERNSNVMVRDTDRRNVVREST